MSVAAARNRAIVARYTDQPERLPEALRDRLEARWGGGSIQLYAFVDLDSSLTLIAAWLVVGPDSVAYARDAGDGGWDITEIDRTRIEELREDPGLSCHVLTLLGRPDDPPLAVVRYTFRQRRGVDAVRGLLERAITDRAAAPDGDADDDYADAVAGPVREAQALVARSEAAVLFRLLGYLRPYRLHVSLGLGAAAMITALSLIPAWAAGYLIDDVVRPASDGSLTLVEAQSVAFIVIGAIAAAYLLRSVCTWVRLRFMSFLGEWVARDLRTELYAHLQTLSLSFYSRKKTGSLITRVSSDTDRLWEFLAFGVVDVSLSIVLLLGLGVVLVSLDWRLGLLMTLPVPLLCGFIVIHSRSMERVFLRAWRKWTRVMDILSDTIPGMRVVKAFNQEQSEFDRFQERNLAAAGEFNQVHRVWTRFWPVLMLAIHLLIVAVWLMALPRLLGVDTPGLTAGTFVSFLLYTTMFVGPIEVIGQMARVMNRATTSAHRIFEVLDTEPEMVDAAEPVRLEPVRGEVRFDNVRFAYDTSRTVLHGVSFRVAPGEMIGLVGPSGGGKTTISNLIARFYDPVSGSVKVDGVDLRDIDTGHYRRQLGMVLQDPYLFHGTVLENIRYGLPEAGLDQVVEAARIANAHDFVCKLPHGYDTVVGERGHTLSGGERQRISIARAVLHDPRILILDEATSAVDSETERAIEEAMHRLVSGRTVFAIAHRLSTLRRADRLFVIEDGRVSEMGTHDQLMSNPESTYRRLVEMQRDLHVA